MNDNRVLDRGSDWFRGAWARSEVERAHNPLEMNNKNLKHAKLALPLGKMCVIPFCEEEACGRCLNCSSG